MQLSKKLLKRDILSSQIFYSPKGRQPYTKTLLWLSTLQDYFKDIPSDLAEVELVLFDRPARDRLMLSDALTDGGNYGWPSMSYGWPSMSIDGRKIIAMRSFCKWIEKHMPKSGKCYMEVHY